MRNSCFLIKKKDYRRYLQDNEVNFKKVLCFDHSSKSFEELALGLAPWPGVPFPTLVEDMPNLEVLRVPFVGMMNVSPFAKKKLEKIDLERKCKNFDSAGTK